MKVKVYMKKNPRRYIREHKYISNISLIYDHEKNEILKLTECWSDFMHYEKKEYEYNMQEVDHVIIEN